MKTTPRNSIPYPEQGDSPNEATAMANLVGQIDRRMVPRFTDAANRTARVPSPSEGMYGYRNDVHRFEIYRGGAWQPAPFSRTVTKAVNTSRTLQPTSTADPELQIPGIISGRTYLVETVLLAFGDPGVDMVLAFGGPTITNGTLQWILTPSATTTSINTNVAMGSAAYTSLGVNALTMGTTSASQISTGVMRMTCQATANGTFSVFWGQNVSSALPTTVLAGSYLSATMIG